MPNDLLRNRNTNGAAPRILVVRVGAMGDVLHAMPAVAALRSALPDAVIGWAVEPHWLPLLRASEGAEPRSASMPLVDAVHPVPARQWSAHPLSSATLRSILHLRRELRSAKYDLAIDLQGSIRSSVIARMSGARQIVGSDAPREPQAKWLYRQRVKAVRANVVEQAVEIVSAAVDLSLQPVKVPLPLSLEAEAWCGGLLLPPGPERVVLLAPTAGWGAKEWPAIRFGELARKLHSHGCTVLVNAMPRGGDTAADRVVACSQETCRAVPCTMPQLMALVQRIHLVIAGDSGPLHLAAAAGIPALGLFGPTDPRRTGPWGSHSRALRNGLSQTDHRRHGTVERGLAEITVDEVLEAALRLLR